MRSAYSLEKETSSQRPSSCTGISMWGSKMSISRDER